MPKISVKDLKINILVLDIIKLTMQKIIRNNFLKTIEIQKLAFIVHHIIF